MKAISKPVAHPQGKIGLADVHSQSKLSLYLVPPVGEITVEELELYAIDRLKGIPAFFGM